MDIIKKLKDLSIRPVKAKYKPVSEREISKIEKKYQTKLSDNFKALIREFGISTFDGMITVKINNNEYPLSVILGSGEGSYGISGYIETYCDRLPEELLAFAEDEFGNLFCIGLNKKTKGKIYFWYHDDHINFINSNKDGNPILIAKSLNEFVDHIVKIPFDDE